MRAPSLKTFPPPEPGLCLRLWLFSPTCLRISVVNMQRFVANALKPGGYFGLVCFAPEGGSGYTDEEAYERGSLGGGLGYTESALREF